MKKQLKIYTFYTDTHKKLLDEYFLPSFEKTNKDLDLIVKKFDQKCPTGEFMSNGWYEAMLNKVDYILESIEETWGDCFIHSDCDVQFFGSIKNDIISQLSNVDIAAEHDGGESWYQQMSCGFFICRSNERTKKLFQNVKRLMNENYNDQQAMNYLAHKIISSNLLDEKYYSVWRSIGLNQWKSHMLIDKIPKNILVHHANWTVGLENKMILMDRIKELSKNNNT